MAVPELESNAEGKELPVAGVKLPELIVHVVPVVSEAVLNADSKVVVFQSA